MDVTIANDDPFANNLRVTDVNAGNIMIYNGTIDEHAELNLAIRADGAGYGNIITYQDGNAGIGRSLLSNGERISL